jgi:uncharacterized protein (TIGR02452 family)
MFHLSMTFHKRVKQRFHLVLLCFETKIICKQLCLKRNHRHVHIKDMLIDGIKNTKMYIDVEPIIKNISSSPLQSVKQQKQTVYNVISGDTLDIALSLKSSYKSKGYNYNPLILNFSCEKQPGGGWQTGSMSQEECIFYRSTCYMSLVDPLHYDEHRSWKYPIPFNGGIYTPNVLVFRDNEKSAYCIRDYEDCVFFDFLSVAAIRKPSLIDDDTLSDIDTSITRQKIRNILRIAFITGHKDILLGAFGCGSFRNPPRHISRLFKDILSEPEFDNVFDHVHFAIKCDGKRKQQNNSNYTIFKKSLMH